MIKPFEIVLQELEGVFRRLEEVTPPPKEVPYEDGYKLRYEERTVQQALLQKFARYIRGLYAIELLCKNGFCQEQGAIQRTLDDIEEDILFLSYGLSGKWTDNHDKYLEYFWMEEPGVGMVKRDKIRAYVLQSDGIDDPSSAIKASKAVFKAYSGFIHANAVAVIDMCEGNPPRFRLSGMLDHPLYEDHVLDKWNYFYRGLVASCYMAKSFSDDELVDERVTSLKNFEARYGTMLFL